MKYKRAKWRIERDKNIIKDSDKLSLEELSQKYFLVPDRIRQIVGAVKGRKKKIHLEYCPNHPRLKTVEHRNYCIICYRKIRRDAAKAWREREKQKYLEITQQNQQGK